MQKIIFSGGGLVLLIISNMNMRLTFTIIAFLTGFTFQLFAQSSSNPMRVEFNARAEVFELVPCGEKGAMMFYQSVKELDSNTKAWVFIFYDTNLEPLWSHEIPVFNDFTYSDYFLSGEHLYLVFQKPAKARSDEYNLQLLDVDIITGNWESESIFTPEEARLVNFQVYQKYFIAGFNYPKDEAILLVRDLDNDQDFPTIFNDNPTFIEDVKMDTLTGEVMAAVNIYTSRKTSALYMNAYDFTGHLKSSVLITPTSPSVKLLNAQLSFVSDKEIYVLGSFNHMNGSVTYNEESTPGEESEGFYIAGIENNEQKFIKTHALLDFQNITKIINNEELAELNNLIKKEQKKGRPQTLYYEFLVHDLRKMGDNFLMLAEAYYPEYHQVSTMAYDFYGRPMPYYYNVFDGYRYFNAFTVCVDPEGDLVWSNGIKIWDKRSTELRKSVDVFIDSADVVMFYNYEGKIISKVVDGYVQLGNVEKTKIATKYTGDVQIESSGGMIRHWYGDCFLAYGYQTLRNSQLGGGSKRRVFYFNKLEFN